MENVVFYKDYSLTKEEQEQASLEWQQVQDTISLSAPLQQYYNAMRSVPKIIIPEHKENYDYLLKLCDSLAQNYYGSVHGVVDYQKWSATIDLIAPFIDFVTEEQLGVLKDIAEKSQSITFQQSDNGGIRVHIFIDYFDDLITDLDRAYIEFETLLQDKEYTKLLGINTASNEGEEIIPNNLMHYVLDYMVNKTGASRQDCFKELATLINDPDEKQALLMEVIDDLKDRFHTDDMV